MLIRKTMCVAGLLAAFIPSVVMADSADCENSGIVSVCPFNSFNTDPESSQYFYCEIEGPLKTWVKIMARNTIIAGYASNCTNTHISLVAPDTKKILNHYYFEVRNGSHKATDKYVRVITTSNEVICHKGKGSGRSLFTGVSG